MQYTKDAQLHEAFCKMFWSQSMKMFQLLEI